MGEKGENITIEKGIQCLKYSQPRSVTSRAKTRKKILNGLGLIDPSLLLRTHHRYLFFLNKFIFKYRTAKLLRSRNFELKSIINFESYLTNLKNFFNLWIKRCMIDIFFLSIQIGFSSGKIQKREQIIRET